MVGDFNGDGKADIVHAVQNTDYVHTWFSRGDGTFDVRTFRPWTGYAIPNGLWLVGDFDGDGKADVVHAVQNTDYVHIWKSRGDGGFNVSTFSPWEGYAIPNGIWLTANITGDRRMDIVHAVNATSYVHPWVSTLPLPGEVFLDGLEVTQVVQDMPHTVPLVANKRTEVRAYLSVNSTSPVTVRGILTLSKPPSTTTTTINSTNTVTINPAQNGQIRPKRENLNLSLNFPVPSSLLAAGQLRATLSIINAGGGPALSCSDCATSPITVQLGNTGPLRVRIIGLRYTTGTPPTTYAPSALDFNLIRSWLGRAYPTAQVNMTQTTVNATNTWPFNCNQANAQISGIRALDVNGGTDHRTHYFGLVADGGGFMRGCAAGIPGSPDPATVASGPTGPSSGWDTDGSYGDWYTGHELGHTFGRFHPGSGCGESSDDPSYPFTSGQLSNADGAFVGFEAGDAAFSIVVASLPGVQWHDVMTYCNNQWLSSYTYTGIRNRLNAEDALPAGPPAPGASAPGSAGAKGVQLIGGEVALSPEAVKPAIKTPPKILTGRQSPPDIKTDRDIFISLPEPAMKPPELPPTALGEPPRIPEPFMVAEPYIQRGLITPATQERAMPQRVQAQVKRGDFVSIVATVNLTRKTGKIANINRVTRALVPEVTIRDVSAMIRLSDPSGKVIGEYPVRVLEDTDIPKGEDKTGLVDAIIPFSPNTATVELILYGQIIDTLKVSKNPPKVRSIQTPRQVERAVKDKVPLVFSWEASDPDNDRLTYSVQISPDNGKTWETIAVGLTEPSVTIDPEQVKDLKTIMIKVIASDGFNSSVMQSKTLQLR
jgi:hypothetical protein